MLCINKGGSNPNNYHTFLIITNRLYQWVDAIYDKYYQNDNHHEYSIDKVLWLHLSANGNMDSCRKIAYDNMTFEGYS